MMTDRSAGFLRCLVAALIIALPLGCVAVAPGGQPSGPASGASAVPIPSAGVTVVPSDVAVIPTAPPPQTPRPTPRRTRRPTAPPITPAPATPTPLPAPNLRIYSVNVYTGATPDERSVYVEVSNVGRAAAGPFIVTVGYSTAEGGGGGFTAEEFPDGLAPRATVQFIRTTTFEPGTYTFTATADADEQVVESREDDNTNTATEVVD